MNTHCVNSIKQINKKLAPIILALIEKGYNPVTQLAGYVLTGDPTYITNHRHARTLIVKIDRYLILEALLHNYLQDKINQG